jgi:hypothetical protein
MLRAKKLRLLNLGDGYSPPYLWEYGLEHLVAMPQLRELYMKAGEMEDPALKRLARARPDLEIARKPFPWHP